ncbi:MAG: type II toxin-antitoxin system PemK/MazF family toxin [Sedimentibacter sp.]
MYSQGDILLIPIPFSDLTSSKKRPVIVLSNSIYNQKTEDILVAAITSNLYEKEYSVLITNEYMKEGTLKVTSSIRIDKIYTLSKFIVIKKFGSAKPELMEQVKMQLFKLLEETR